MNPIVNEMNNNLNLLASSSSSYDDTPEKSRWCGQPADHGNPSINVLRPVECSRSKD